MKTAALTLSWGLAWPWEVRRSSGSGPIHVPSPLAVQPRPVSLEVLPTPCPPDFLPAPCPVLLEVPSTPALAPSGVPLTPAHVPSRVPVRPKLVHVSPWVPPAPATDPSIPARAIQRTLEGSHCGVRRPPVLSRLRLARSRARLPAFRRYGFRPQARSPDSPSRCLRPRARPPEFTCCGLRPSSNFASPLGRPPENPSWSSALPPGRQPNGVYNSVNGAHSLVLPQTTTNIIISFK